MWWRNAWMLKCRRVLLARARPSRYGKLRKEPRRDGLATIEAAAMLLARLEENPKIEAALNTRSPRCWSVIARRIPRARSGLNGRAIVRSVCARDPYGGTRHAFSQSRCVVVCRACGSFGGALAQSAKSDPPAADFKPLVAPVLPPNLLPRNSNISPGSITGDPITPYSSTPGYDATRSAPAPGLRLTIPR